MVAGYNAVALFKFERYQLGKRAQSSNHIKLHADTSFWLNRATACRFAGGHNENTSADANILLSGHYSSMTQFPVSLGSAAPLTEAAAIAAWFAVQAKPNAAHIAARNLVRQGFEVFMPLERYTLRRGRSLAQALRPYFSGYLFVGFDPEIAPWRAIRSTQGVLRLVSFGATPAPVDNQLIQELKLACDNEGIMHAHLDAQPGDPLRVAEGPLTGLIGKLERMAPQQRAWVLLEVMGQPTRVSLPLAALRQAG